ncbi:MAG: DUF371 domain-containing protein [Candidatus Woesearchaeota archaeon]
MKYTFYAFGHENIQGKHRNTFEFTTDKELTLDGDCIIGVRAEFDQEKIKPFLNSKKLKMILKVRAHKEEICFIPNPSFSSSHEIVIRIGEFLSDRTLGTRADKPSLYLDRKMIELMKNPEERMEVTIEEA